MFLYAEQIRHFSENLILSAFYFYIVLYYGIKGNKTRERVEEPMTVETKDHQLLGSVKMRFGCFNRLP